jgi:tRNA nucleotidyltransferase (CCA-adding enzyme)
MEKISLPPKAMLDSEGKITVASKDFAIKLGFDLKELVGLEITKFVPESFITFAERAITSGGKITVVGRDGRLHDFDVVRSKDGILLVDFNELPEAIKRSYRGVWDFHYVFLFTSTSGDILTANKTFYDHTGLKPDEVEGRKLWEVFGDAGRRLLEAAIKSEKFDGKVKINEKSFTDFRFRIIEVYGRKIVEIVANPSEKVNGEYEKELYRMIVENSLDTIVTVGEGGYITYVNPAIRSFGYEPEEVIGKQIFDFLAPSCSDEVKKLYWRAYKTGLPQKGEFMIFDKEGNVRYVEVVGSLMRREDGNVAGGVIVVRDTTEKRKIMDELRESRELYKVFFETSPDFVGIIDPEGRIVYANRNFIKTSSLKVEEITGRNAFDFVAEEDKERAITLFKNALRDGQPRRERINVVIGDRKFVFEVSGNVIFDENGKPRYLIIVSRDITKRVELEKRLRESEERYRVLAENSLIGIFVYQDGKIVYVNSVLENLTGYSKEEIYSRGPFIILEKEFIENAKENLNRALKGEMVRVFSRYITKNGEKRWAELLMTPIEYNGKIAVLGNFLDITDRKIAEKKLMESEEMYRTLAENSHTGIFIIQGDKIIYSNEKVFELVGYTSDDFKRFKHPYDIVSPEHRDLVKSRLKARLEGREVPNHYEVKIITKNGEERWLRVIASRITYKGKPAVMVNLADVTDLKEKERKLENLNKLLSVINEINRIVSHEKTDFRLLNGVRKALEKLDVKAAVLLYERSDLIPLTISLEIDESVVEDPEIRNCIVERKTLSKKAGSDFLTCIPLADDQNTFGGILLFSKTPFDEDSLRMLENLASDIAFALRSMRIEKEREAAINIIVDNLNHFEELADKLRNPLAIIKGYLEIRDEMDYDDLIKKIEIEADRIEKILDQLREKELVTYKMKKMMESRKS